MNTIERRALYNLLRMNWLNEPSLAVESWQVEDYRDLPLSSLFDRLAKTNIQLDRTSFIAYADECDSPEDLTDHLIGDRDLESTDEDRIYLVIFELWRRLMSEKPSISILCNELDHQIFLYDSENLENPLALHDSLMQFVQILDENVDEGIPPHQALKLIATYCANDIETFLYDFISELIDEGNESYAHELLDSFNTYLANNKWFNLLRIRLCGHAHSKITQKLTAQIIEEHLSENDLDFNLELLALLSELGDYNLFCLIAKQTLSLTEQEEDFQDMLSIAIDCFHRLDQEHEAAIFQSILDRRATQSSTQPINHQDPDLITFVQHLKPTF